MFALSLEYFLSFPWRPSTNIDFLFLLKISFERQNQNLQKNSGRVKSWMGFVGQILIKLETSSIRCFPQSRLWCSIGDNFSKYALYFLSWSMPYSPSPFCGHVMFYVCMMTSSNGNISALLALCAGNHRSPVTSPHKGQLRGALLFSLIRAWINGRVNNHQAGDLRRHRAHYDSL